MICGKCEIIGIGPYSGYRLYVLLVDSSLRTRLKILPEHLAMPAPDAILVDFSDSEWHFTFEGAVKLANAYPSTI
jgi:hypothetical protein